MPLASAVSLDALLRLGRGLLPRMTEAGLPGLLDCDLRFSLPGRATAEAEIMVLAEGGYALRGLDGCRAIAAELAEQLIRRGHVVPATSF
jgi:hypothetical protein